MNLREETLNCLERHGKSSQDVVAVCGLEFSIPWDNFISLADTDYDNGFGGEEVACDLKIIGKDFVMVRRGYDGSEWWCYIGTIPPEKTENVCCLTRGQSQCLRQSVIQKKQIDNSLFYADEYVLSQGTLSEYNSQAKGEDL